MRRLLLCGLALCLAPLSTAQVDLSARLGLNTSSIVLSEGTTSDRGARLGFVAGVTADYPISPLVGIHAEILYSQKGSTQEVPAGTVTSTLDYLEVPILAQVTIPAVEYLDLAVVAGPAISTKLSAGISCDFPCVEGADRTKSVNLSGAVGLSAASGPFGVDVRLTRGVGSVFPDDDPVFQNRTVNYSVLSVAGLYRFGR
ncbi:MAG: porin family protein [Bacteroidota bacterium]